MRQKEFSQQVDVYLKTAHVVHRGIRNIATTIDAVGQGTLRVPVTINSSERCNSWICSPYTTYVSYAAEELERFGHPLYTKPLSFLCQMLGNLLLSARIDDTVTVNNWLVSTNCYPEAPIKTVNGWIEESVSRWPSHAIWFRSLNRRYTSEWLSALTAAGCILIPSRQVYLFDCIQANARTPKNLRWDFALLDQWRNRRSDANTWNSADYVQAEKLYGKLYLEKYSKLNPQYTSTLLSAWSNAGLLSLIGYRSANGELIAVIGMLELDGTVTAPIVGYDTSLPQRLGLYRLLMATIFERAAETGQRVNLSAGAAGFKRLRGGIPEIEYSAVYSRHLPAVRRHVLSALSILARRIGEPIMRKYEL
ncbi:MAG TPA: GNAT family N-acetyltransferase [Steroidobacteraceae bacterium]|nr:GNAT family N-acetyltransferase [Steroidobacteraceae bacterium]